MSEFYMDTTVRIMHADGWGYEISQEDDGVFAIEAVEPNELTHTTEKTGRVVDGIWAEALPLIANAFMQLYNQENSIKCPQND